MRNWTGRATQSAVVVGVCPVPCGSQLSISTHHSLRLDGQPIGLAWWARRQPPSPLVIYKEPDSAATHKSGTRKVKPYLLIL